MGKNKKTGSQNIKRALEQLNVSPYESIYVGDHPENDVKATQNVYKNLHILAL